MFSPVASTIFTFRNVEKTENGEIGRAPVFIGQATGVLGEISKYDNAIAVGTKNVLSVFGDLSKESKVLDYAGKFAKFASNNVNPLIAVSGGVKVMTSDDKQSTAITEASALSAMFGSEAIVKNNYEKLSNSETTQKVLSSKYLKPVVGFLEKQKFGGAAGAVIKGALFVGASISSYEAGRYIGDKAAKYVKGKQEEKDKTIQDTEQTLQVLPSISSVDDDEFADVNFGKINQLA